MVMGTGEQQERVPGPDVAEEAVGTLRQNGMPYCRALSSEFPGRTVHSPRSHGPVRQIQVSANTLVH